MLIRTKLQISGIFFITMAIVIGFALFWASQAMEKEAENGAFADHIVDHSFELNILTSSYLLQHADRVEMQWHVKSDALTTLLATSEIVHPAQRIIVNRIRDHSENIRVLFVMLVENRGKDTAVSREKEVRLTGQISVRIQSIFSDASQLHHRIHENAVTVQQRLKLLIVMCLVIITVSSVVTALWIDRSIAGPVRKLYEGTQIIARGNLDHLIDVGSRDEIGRLAQAFNAMTRTIRQSYAALEEEITVRKQAEAALQATNASLEEMVYIASHDLQTPLLSMEGFAGEILENYQDALDTQGMHQLERIQANARRMHKLVLSLLDISRLNTIENWCTTFSAGDVVDSVLRDLALTIEHAGATVEIEDLPRMYGDQQRIEGVFRRLISNALTYRGKQVTIGCQDGVYVVKDDGIGIYADQLQKIFKPGEQLKDIHTEGVGMGLTFCQKVITQHHGRIWAESEGVGKGAAFYFEIATNPPNTILPTGPPTEHTERHGKK